MDRRGFLSGAIAGASAFSGVKSEETRGELREAAICHRGNDGLQETLRPAVAGNLRATAT